MRHTIQNNYQLHRAGETGRSHGGDYERTASIFSIEE
jgi:hypothetical protein